MWDARYVASNAVSTGVNTREGPSQSFVVNGRFPGDCTVGFSAYCIGDPIPGAFGNTPHEHWLGTRWLELAKHHGGLGGWLASILSNERPERQFIAESLINPQRPYTAVRQANDCPGSYPAPGQAKLAPADASAGNGLAILSAKAPHARNMGFAVWQPPGQPFVDQDAYVQVYSPEGEPEQNPGATGEDGEKKVIWRFRDQQIANLQSGRTPASRRPEATCRYRAAITHAEPRCIVGWRPGQPDTWSGLSRCASCNGSRCPSHASIHTSGRLATGSDPASALAVDSAGGQPRLRWSPTESIAPGEARMPPHSKIVGRPAPSTPAPARWPLLSHARGPPAGADGTITADCHGRLRHPRRAAAPPAPARSCARVHRP